MPLIPFASFVIVDYLNPFAFQSFVISGVLFVALFFATYKKELKIPFIAIPYVALPLLLLASVNRKLEFASNDMLLCLSMLAGAILIFSQKELYSKWLFRTMLVCGNLHLVIQIYGIIKRQHGIAVASTFNLANEIMFFYMLVAFSAIFAFCKENDFWKKYAAIIGSLVFISIILGDPTTIGKITSEDAVGIWLGLVCGTLFSLILFLWKKFNLPKIPALSISALFFLTMILAPVIVIYFQIIPKSAMVEAISRLANWQAAYNLIMENPFGIGFGAYGANIMQHLPTMEEAYFTTYANYIAAHNQYLQILTEIGWLGLLYYSALFGLPWFIAISRYLKTGKLHFLFIAGTLAAMLSVMEVAEAISMFAFIQIIHWGFLIYCVKAVLPDLPLACRNSFNIRFLYVLPFMLLTAYLLIDRGKQLKSMTFTDPIERRFLQKIPHLYPLETAAKNLDKALEIYPKNAMALWYKSEIYIMTNEYGKALKTIDALEEVSGYLRPVNHARAEIYVRMGNIKKACEFANFTFQRYDDGWTLSLKERLNGCKNY